MTTFKRSTELNHKKLRPGEYIQYKQTDVWVLYKCPKCGLSTTLGKAFHHVNYDGVVEPAASCPHKFSSGNQCGFSDKIVLEGWVPEAKGSA